MSTNKTHIARRRARAADRDLVEQLRAIGDSVSKHRQALDALLPDMAAGDPGAVPAGHCELFDPDALTERKRAARRAGENLVLLELERAETLGVVRSLASTPSRRKLEALRRDYPHFGAVVDLIEMRCALARLSLGQALSMPPILLSGPPGVGKTAFADAIADCLGLPLRRVDIASSTAGFVIAGSHSSWSASRPGVVWSLLQSKTAAGVLTLDEIDKAGESKYPVLGPLYALLERSSAKHFTDEFMDIPVDASNLTWIATCNQAELIDSALRSRFVEFTIPMPTPQQMAAIARSVYRRLRETTAWAQAFDPELPVEVVEALTAATPRQLVRTFEDAHAHAAVCSRRSLLAEDIDLGKSGNAKDARRIGFV